MNKEFLEAVVRLGVIMKYDGDEDLTKLEKIRMALQRTTNAQPED